MTRKGWIKRRARRLQKAFRISRHMAVACAAEDYVALHGRRA